HSPCQAPKVAGKSRIRYRVQRAPGIARNSMSKDRNWRSRSDGAPEISRRKQEPPGPQVGGRDPRIHLCFLDAASFEVPAQILEGDYRIRDAAFGPVEEDAAILRQKDVSGIDIDVPESVGDAKVFEQRAGLHKTFVDRSKLTSRQWCW